MSLEDLGKIGHLARKIAKALVRGDSVRQAIQDDDLVRTVARGLALADDVIDSVRTAIKEWGK
jgi:hypothetical protein